MSEDISQNKYFRFKTREKLPRLSPRVAIPSTSIEVQTCVSYAEPLKTTTGIRKFSFDYKQKRRNIHIESGELTSDSFNRKTGSSPKVNHSSLKSIAPVTYFPDFGLTRSVDVNRKSLVNIRRSFKFSKFMDYSPSRKSIKIRSKFEKVYKSDPCLNIKGDLIQKQFKYSN